MPPILNIHPDNPQSRLIHQAIAVIQQGGIMAYPTDSCYALGCHLGDKAALARLRTIRQLDHKHNFTLVGQSLAELSAYTRLSNSAHRWVRTLTPGPYTFILPATKQVPKRLWHPKRKTVGIRIPDNAIALALCAQLGEPLVSTTLHLPDDASPLTDPYDMQQCLAHQVDLVIDGGYCGDEPTSVVRLDHDTPEVLRHGKGDVTLFSSS
jgi:tRNA threonylcarbamoyl adenosine modification protein (Sua5/YciO/YrdC/YwlC family)